MSQIDNDVAPTWRLKCNAYSIVGWSGTIS
jgi:hypothetical protein